ncbi:RES family NAD+ phosphorylase [Rhodococcus jostii]|uniref:RES domain-containing protein n=1 Tax=Rhodococcus jostii TaxID=132919 RepID=A0A1H4IW57_RHOJO|nr:RES family NAD+ phosphorylase [Rhodococcus jostii]SEB37528.1 RES domain-containing protein [Rhodococcus jostii]
MTERYNGRPPQTRVIPAGTTLHRISGTGSPYPPNSFNAKGIRALGDPLQGRFEPIDDSHGGYLYVALSLAGAVAEGILRDIPIPRSGIVRRTRLAGKTHTRMVLGRDITVASLLDGDLRSLNLSGTLVGCDRSAYTWSRTTCHQILGADPSVDGVIYRCRNNPAELALMLLDRGALDSAALPIAESNDVLTDPGTCDEVVKVLDEVHHLKYVGAGSARLP